MAKLEGVDRRQFLAGGLAAGILPRAQAKAVDGGAVPTSQIDDRSYWLRQLQRVSEPVLKALRDKELRRRMPVEAAAGQAEARAVGTHLEALGRLLAGIAPWLELEPSASEKKEETMLRERYREWARAGIASAVDPGSPDYMRFGESPQTLVDSSFLALALLRAPQQLLRKLDENTQERLAEALVKERAMQPPFNNWLLFAAMNEALLKVMERPWDRMRVDYALREHQTWYLGDGVYGDGPHFHSDFYNSFVIQPYLLQLLETLGDSWPASAAERAAVPLRAQRYAAVQERMIGPDGHYPALGRSITYRCGAFHLLADVVRRGLLPEALSLSQVRGALTAVMRRTLDAEGTFSSDGWLQIGLAGHQPGLGEAYISTGSLYLCSAAWLPLGLPPSDLFWSSTAEPWSSQKIWGGRDMRADHAYNE
jgi:hypothetical protein